MRLRSCLLILLALVLVLPAAAQRRWGQDHDRDRDQRRGRDRDDWAPLRSTTRGFFVEAGASGNSFTVDDGGAEETNTGGGLGLRLGYGFTPTIAGYVAFVGAGMEADDGTDYGLGHVDLGVQLSFARPRQALIPYLNVALSGIATEYEAPQRGGPKLRYTGGAFVLGGGARYYVSRGVALNVGLEGYGGSFNQATLDGDGTDVTTDLDDVALSGARLRAGLVWFPGAGRR